MKIEAIILSNEDNVATVLADLEGKSSFQIRKGEDIVEFRVAEPIRYGHKIALRHIEKGDNIIKYNEVIGRATKTIEPGYTVHVHNVESLRGRGDLD